MCKLNLKLTAGPFGIVIEEEQQMSCAKFEPQWAYEWQISDSDWAQMILKFSDQGHRADMGRFRPVCEKMHESHRLG